MNVWAEPHQSTGQSASETVGRQWMGSICRPNFDAGALFARCPQFLEGPVQVSGGTQPNK